MSNTSTWVWGTVNYSHSYNANPGDSGDMAVLETADSDAVFTGFQNRVSVTVGTARTAGRYTDTLTCRFALVQ